MCLALALTCAAVAYLIAVGQRFRWPALAAIFTLAQPLVFLHSFSELTELPFAATIALAFLAYQRRQFLIMVVLLKLKALMKSATGFGAALADQPHYAFLASLMVIFSPE
jgi:hypothetical protein